MSEPMTMNSNTTRATGGTPGWVKGGLLTTFAFAACWGGAISYWRTTGRMPATWELGLYLLGLPLLLVLGFWVGRKVFAARDGSAGGATQSVSGSGAAAPARVAGLAILAASLRAPHGASPGELAAAIAENKARPDLDQELVDEDGFPVMTARCEEATDDALKEEITEWLEQNRMRGLHFSEEQWRAVTLATGVAGELASYAGTEIFDQADSPLILQLLPILPGEWNIDHRRAVGMWLTHTVVQSGLPRDGIRLVEEVVANPDATTPAAILNGLAREASMTDGRFVAMVLACDSNIGDETVSRWADNGSLFTSSQTKGLIPGEGAAGLLVSDLRQASSMHGAAFAVLDALEEERRDSSADETRRVDAKVLSTLAENVFKRSGVSSSDVARIFADTDHRSSRALELLGYVSAAMPQLDGADDVERIGVAMGSCGAVPFFTALALAHHHVLELKAPVLCVSNDDAFRRIVTLVRPAECLS
jgi:hypothetical protein